MKATDWIGWAAGLVLLITVGWQVYTQWQSGKSAGLSRWLFVGQMTASIGFVIYSWLVENWVFVVTNAFMLITACIGQFLFLRSKAEAHKSPNARTNFAAANGQGK